MKKYLMALSILLLAGTARSDVYQQPIPKIPVLLGTHSFTPGYGMADIPQNHTCGPAILGFRYCGTVLPGANVRAGFCNRNSVETPLGMESDPLKPGYYL